MELNLLEPNDDILFKYPEGSNYFPGKVVALHYNFEGDMYIELKVDTETVYIDGNYDIVKI